MKKIFWAFCFLLCLTQLSAQHVEADWESIKTNHPYPQWFKDAKLGIFIHWGVYSVPSYCHSDGYAEWYCRGLMTNDSNRVAFQKKNFGEDF